MEATYNVNKQENRVEIRFPFPPSKPIRRQLHAKDFTYNPDTKMWTKDHVTGAKVQAGTIVFNFNSELD